MSQHDNEFLVKTMNYWFSTTLSNPILSKTHDSVPIILEEYVQGMSGHTNI